MNSQMTRFSFHTSKPSFSLQLLFAPSDPWAIFPQNKLESWTHNSPGGVLPQGTQLCTNSWALLTRVPSWCKLVTWTVKDHNWFTSYLTSQSCIFVFSSASWRCLMCSEPYSTVLHGNSEHAFTFAPVLIPHFLGFGRWRLLISVSIALSMHILFCCLLPPPLPWFSSPLRAFGPWRNPTNLSACSHTVKRLSFQLTL